MRLPGTVTERCSDEAEVWSALVTGLRDYVRKNGFRSVILGLSGGIDSSVVAAIAVDALGPQQVYGVSMPSGHSSQHSQDDAADLAQRTGLHFHTEPIQPMVDAFLMRPLGLLMLGASCALFVPAAAITYAVRPADIGVTYDIMLRQPVRYVFVDPLGSH